jgi:branched-chain amino acid transport system substrate-binding protein
MRRLVLIASVCVGWVSAVPAWAEETQPIKIGVVGPFTGKSSTDMGLSILGGAQVFAEDINRIGGILGRRVQIVPYDDQAKADIGVQSAKDLITKDKVVAAVGYANTGVALPSSKVFQEAKIPLIVTAATGMDVTTQFALPKFPENYIFRVAASDAIQPVAILRDIIDRRGFNAIALLHDESPYGQLGKKNVLAEMERRKLKPVIIESFKVGDQDMTEQLKRAREAGAEVVITYSLGTEAAMLTNSARKLKWNVPIVGPWGMSQLAYATLAGANAEGARMAVTFIEDEFNTRSVSFKLNYQRINNVRIIPSAVAAAQTYDALVLLFFAIVQAQSTEGPQVRKALENLDIHVNSAVMSRYHHPFSPTDHEAVSLNMVVMGQIHNGVVTYANLDDAKTRAKVREKTSAQ